MKEIGIMEIGGFSIGHAQDFQGGTGCTVFLLDKMSPGGLDVRGGGPAARESQLLSPLAAAQGVNALLFSGGSAFGLDAAGGVQQYLEERDIGFDTGIAKVPLVCQSCLFDLGVASSHLRPDRAMAYRACENAGKSSPAQGNVGAGTGCSVGKYRGMERAMKSGFATFALQAGELKVGAAVAVNALGDIYQGDKMIAGLMNREKTGLSPMLLEMAQDMDGTFPGPGLNTTLGAVFTNARLDKAALCKVAGMAHNGYARAIRPVHTSADGDSIYAFSVGQTSAPADSVGILAAMAMEQAILRSVKECDSAYGLISWKELHAR